MLDLEKSTVLNKSYEHKQLFCEHMPEILSSGGYRDPFLSLLGKTFNASVVKCHDHLKYVIRAIDYLDSFRNDCFFKFEEKAKTVVNTACYIERSSDPK